MMRFAPVTRNLAKLLDIKSLKILDNYAQFNPVPLSVEQFVEFGVRALETESYHFLKKELPVRFANIMKEMNSASLKELLGEKKDINGEDVKCVVFMSNVLDIKRTQLVIQTLGEISKRNIAIGGCIGNLAYDSGDNTFANLKQMLQGH